MGLYNRLQIDGPCQNCGDDVTRILQFKFGYRRLYDLAIGDTVSWATGRERSLNYGQPTPGRAWVPAYAEEPCPNCETDFTRAEFAVVIEGERLVDTDQAPVGFFFPEDRIVFKLASGLDRPEPVTNGSD